MEEIQLRQSKTVQKWAILLAAVATRVEQMKDLARREPGLAVECILEEHEIQALLWMKKRQKKKT